MQTEPPHLCSDGHKIYVSMLHTCTYTNKRGKQRREWGLRITNYHKNWQSLADHDKLQEDKGAFYILEFLFPFNHLSTSVLVACQEWEILVV